MLFLLVSIGPLCAEPTPLRCGGHSTDRDKEPITFSVMIDPTKRLVLDMGSGNDVETSQFSDTAITATQKGAAFNQILVIDRITGQFSLIWVPIGTTGMGKGFEGTCAATSRKF
jgi:hypothetical protein